MKKVFKSLLLTICAFTFFTITANASTIATEDIPNKSYLIGKALYTEDITLTTRHIMLGARTINSNDLNDMVIYYKNFRGVWVDALTGETKTVDEYVQVDYIDLASAIEMYTITFDSQGGSEVAMQYITEHEYPTEPEPPVKEGYIFGGWRYLDEPFNFNSYILSDVELVTTWTPITYTIAFDKNAEDATGTMESIPCTYDNEYPLTLNGFTRENYTFEGWATSADGEVVYTDEENVTNLTTTNENTVTLYAVWTADEFTITYGGLEGATVSNPVKYTVESTFTLNNPEREGYTFLGWTGSNGDVPQEEVTIAAGTTGALTYTANWEANTYTISFNKNANEATGTMEDIECTYGVECVLPENTYSRTGYVTDGWATSADGEKVHNPGATSTSFTLEDEYELFVHWIPDVYTITYTGLEGATVSNPENYTIEDTFTLNNPTKGGYTFTGWTGSNGNVPQLSITVSVGSTGSLTYNANWTEATYEIQFHANANDATGEMSNLECTYGTSCTLTPNAFERNGYDFSGWAETANGAKLYDDEAENTAFTTEAVYDLYAVWTPKNYTISYELHDGNASNLTINYNIETNNFVLATPTRTGYTFLGWTGDNGDTPETTVTIEKGTYGNLSFEANWAITNYDIVYNKNANDATGQMDNTTCTYNTDCVLSANSYTREDYVFAGWSLTDSGEIIEGNTVNTLTTTESEVTIYAIWTPVWEFDSSTGTIIKYNGTEENVIIPEQIDSVNVTTIAADAFESSTMRTLEFSQYITLVEDGAIKKADNPNLAKVYLTAYQFEDAPETDWLGILDIESYDGHGTSMFNNPDPIFGVETYGFNESQNIDFYNIELRYNIVYNLDGGSATNPEVFFAFDDDFTLNNPTKEGYTFAGWTSNDITITDPFEVIIPFGTTGDLTFTATWTQNS